MRALGRVAWACLLLLQLAGASHVVYDNLLELEKAAAAAAVPPSIIDPLLRTGYHFQPRKNWINGNVKTCSLADSVEVCRPTKPV
jgi:beta-fructofuranosidase